ncbi:hypothetical protein FG379_001291 [Cryptosporidium bovis]|uniref:uncharacterized protein n=1 Tax=Cryptosporidium bovis TaxID=310047 RepID=UPI00351A5C9F|nr:hypothetical protein FG379_001291 [Cryptosporidium bovis]
MKIEDETNTLKNSEIFEKTKSLSYIIENDEDYGSKLTELLSHNSKGVPVLSISKIGLSNSINTVDNKEIESLIDVLFSNSEVINASEVKFDHYSDSDDFFDEYNSNRESISETKSEEDQINNYIAVPEEKNDSLISSNKLSSYFENMYGECDKVIDDGLEFDIEQKEVELTEAEYACGGEEFLIDKLDSDSINECFEQNELKHEKEELSCENSEKYMRNTVETVSIEQASENEASNAYYKDSDKLDFDGIDVNNLAMSGKAVNEELKEDELHGVNLGQDRYWDHFNSNIGIEAKADRRQGMSLTETFNLDNAESQDNIIKWKLKISNLMRTDNEYNKFSNNRSSYMEEANIKSNTYFYGTSHHTSTEDEIQTNNYDGGLSALMATSKKDLKSDVISEIENELKNCRLSLDINSNRAKNYIGIGSSDLNLALDDLFMDCSEYTTKYDSETSIFNDNKHYLTSSPINKSNIEKNNEDKNTSSDLKNSILSSTLNVSKMNECESTVDNNSSSTLNVKLYPRNKIEKNTEIDFSETLNLTHYSVGSGDFCLENTLRLNSSGGNNRHKNSKYNRNEDLEEAESANTKIRGLGNSNAVSFQPATPDPNDIVVAIKLLALVKDVKKQISLIKSKRFV